MPRWDESDLRAYEQRRSSDPDTRIRPAYTEPTKRDALECPLPRKEAGSQSPTQRLSITFIVYSRRPCDWDGYHVKELQDMLVHAGVLLSDDWTVLEGRIISRKAHTKEEERTVIEITALD